MLPHMAKETLHMCLRLRFLRRGDYLGLSRQTLDITKYNPSYYKVLVSRGGLDYGKRQCKAESTLTARGLCRGRRRPEPSNAWNEALETEKGKLPFVWRPLSPCVLCSCYPGFLKFLKHSILFFA